MGGAAQVNGPVLLLGAAGMLGRAMSALLAERRVDFRTLDLPSFDLSDPASIDRQLVGQAAVIINCAAYTDVDGAEAKLETARAVNARGVELLSRRCVKLGAVLVHYSTDYVFNGRGTRPYLPGDERDPVNAYGVSKAEGEQALLSSGAQHLLLRTSWLYAPWGKNFVRTIAKLAADRPVLKVVNDQRGRPTSAEHLARATLALLDAGARGIHHATDAGECTWYEFARAIVEGLGLPARVEPCTSAEYPRPAVRPAYSVLDITSTEKIIGPLAHWTTTLSDVLPRLERPL